MSVLKNGLLRVMAVLMSVVFLLAGMSFAAVPTLAGATEYTDADLTPIESISDLGAGLFYMHNADPEHILTDTYMFNLIPVEGGFLVQHIQADQPGYFYVQTDVKQLAKTTDESQAAVWVFEDAPDHNGHTNSFYMSTSGTQTSTYPLKYYSQNNLRQIKPVNELPTPPQPNTETFYIWQVDTTPPQPETYTVTYEYTGDVPAGAPAVPTDSAEYEEGDAVTVANAPTMEGYTFDGWYLDNEKVSEFDMPGNDVTLTGSWTKNSHKVTYEYTGDVPAGAPAVPEEKTYEYGATVPAAEVPTMEGYTFSGWEGEVTTMPDEDVTVTGSWTKNSHKVTYEYTGEVPAGAPAVPEEKTYEYGATVPAAEVPTMEGYTFSGWEGEVTTMPDEDVTVTGSWTKNSHKVTYEYTGEVPAGAPAVPEEKTYEYGATVPAAEVPTMEGYTFSGWEGEVTTMPDEDVTVTGSWTKNESPTYTVTYEFTGDVPEGVTPPTDDNAYEEGAEVTVAADPAEVEGYTFEGWDKSGTFEMPGENVTITGKWTKNESPDDGGSDEKPDDSGSDVKPDDGGKDSGGNKDNSKGSGQQQAKTGDVNHTWIWIVLAAVAALVTAITLIVVKRRDRRNEF